MSPGLPESVRPARLMATLAVLLLVLAGCESEHCDGECPPPDPGVRVDADVIQKTSWVDAARNGVTIRDHPFCLPQLGESLTGHVVVMGNKSSLLLTLRRGQLPITSVLQGSDVWAVDLDGDARPEFVSMKYLGTSLERDLYLYRDDGVEVWASDYSVVMWQTMDVDSDGFSELVVQAEDGLHFVNSLGEEVGRIGSQRYYSACPGFRAGAAVITTSHYPDPGGPAIVQTWSIEGELLEEYADPYYYDCRSGLSGSLSCRLNAGSWQDPDSGYRAQVSNTRILRSSPWGIFGLGHRPGVVPIEVIRTIIRITDGKGRVVYDEVLFGGVEGAGAAVISPEFGSFVIVAWENRLFRYILPGPTP